MAKVSREAGAVHARILYWGATGSGKTANLRAAHARLRPDHRGEIREEPSRLDPSVTFEVLPISLGAVGGVHTALELVAVPGGDEQAPMRKQLLDQVDGIVLVVDAAAGLEPNEASLRELAESLAAYGRSLQDLPVVVQYNKRDLADPYALEDLHRKLDPGGSPVFEAVAREGNGVLETLSTVSKQVIRALRGQPVAAPAPAAPAAPLEEPSTRMEQAILEEPGDPEAAELDAAAIDAQELLDTAWPEDELRPSGARIGAELSIVSVGEARRSGERSVQVPVVLGDGEGNTSTLLLTLQLDPLLEEDPG